MTFGIISIPTSHDTKLNIRANKSIIVIIIMIIMDKWRL